MKATTARSTEVVEYQVLDVGERAASISLLSKAFANSILLQLARIDTGSGWAVSIYAVYREGPMTFEAIAKLVTVRPTESLESVLRELTEEPEFLASVLRPLAAQVEKHFAQGRTSA